MGDRRSISAALERLVEQKVVEIAVHATANLVAATPVDTGFARASWIPSLGAPVSADASEPGAQSRGMADIVRFKLIDGKAFVTNNAKYIRRLNGGSSTQAPAGFVEHAVAQAVTAAKAVAEPRELTSDEDVLALAGFAPAPKPKP